MAVDAQSKGLLPLRASESFLVVMFQPSLEGYRTERGNTGLVGCHYQGGRSAGASLALGGGHRRLLFPTCGWAVCHFMGLLFHCGRK